MCDVLIYIHLNCAVYLRKSLKSLMNEVIDWEKVYNGLFTNCAHHKKIMASKRKLYEFLYKYGVRICLYFYFQTQFSCFYIIYNTRGGRPTRWYSG